MSGMACRSNFLLSASFPTESDTERTVASSRASITRGRGPGTHEMKAPLIDQRLELAILGAVAAFACGLASIQGDHLFVALFGAASVGAGLCNRSVARKSPAEAGPAACG